jgi:hypothetical protein
LIQNTSHPMVTLHKEALVKQVSEAQETCRVVKLQNRYNPQLNVSSHLTVFHSKFLKSTSQSTWYNQYTTRTPNMTMVPSLNLKRAWLALS